MFGLLFSPFPISRINKKNSFYYNGDDCPYISDDLKRSEPFLQWVWDNRNRIEIAGVPPYCYDDDDFVCFVTTPYILGGWMFIRIGEYGVDLYVAEDLEKLGRKVPKATYCPNWNFVSMESRRIWVKLYSWYKEKVALARQEGHNRNWVNPKLNKHLKEK